MWGDIMLQPVGYIEFMCIVFVEVGIPCGAAWGMYSMVVWDVYVRLFGEVEVSVIDWLPFGSGL